MTHSTPLVLFTAFLTFTAITTATAQADWNWPEQQELFATAQEKQAFSRVSMQLENYEDVYQSVSWLYENNPNLHESIYIDGAKAVEKLIQETDDDAYKQTLQDTLLTIYDLRLQYFDNDAEVMGRKAYAAFKQYYNQPARYSLLAQLYDTAYAMNPDRFQYFNMTPYMTLAKYYYQRKPEEMPATRVLDIHDKLSISISAQESSDPAKMKREQDKIDALLSSLGEILTCEFIATKLVPKLEADSSDLNTAKKIFAYSLKAKCTDQPYFLDAGNLVFENDPTYELASALGNKHLNRNETETALKYFQAGLKLTTDSEKLYETYYNIAVAFSNSSQKLASRTAAFEALKVRPGDKKAYNLMGNLYFTSYQDCKGGESIITDRAVFIAAYDMYEKAGNQEQMAACKEQFPSSEEIFNENREVGQEITVGCWINTPVKVRRRD